MLRSYLQKTVERLLRCSTSRHFHNSGLFETVDGLRIHYLRVGRGAHNLLLLPGPLGSAITDYTPFLENLNKLRFTAVAIDPSGQGFSTTSEERSWKISGRLEQDAAIGLHLMRQLKLTPFSILGWAEGAITALVMLSICSPEEIYKLAIWAHEGAVPCPIPSSVRVTGSDALEPYRRISDWPIAARAPLEAIYGPNQLKRRWEDYLEAKRSGIIIKNTASRLESRLEDQMKSHAEYTKLLLMRGPGRINTEDWLTYALTKLGHARTCNWMNQCSAELEENQRCWGPHRSNPQEFQKFIENFLCFDQDSLDEATSEL